VDRLKPRKDKTIKFIKKLIWKSNKNKVTTNNSKMAQNKSKYVFQKLVRDEANKQGKNYPQCMINEVAEILMTKAQGQYVSLDLKDDNIVVSNPNNGEIYGFSRNPNFKKGGETIHIKQENDRLYNEIKMFECLPDDILYNHNVLNKYMVLTNDEFIEEIKRMTTQLGSKLLLNDCDIRTTKIRNNKYYRITFHHKEVEQSSRVECVFGHFVLGFTYIFKAEAFKQNKDKILELVEHKETEFGKNTRWDIGGDVYNKKSKKKGKKGRKD